MEKENKGEFGKGFVYNLFLFAKHWWRDYPNDTSYLWFNGAGDHFFELEIPEQFREKDWAKKLRGIQEEVLKLRMEYGQRAEENKERIFNELEEVILEIDRDLGIDPLKADWN